MNHHHDSQLGRKKDDPRQSPDQMSLLFLQQSHICKGLFCKRALLQKGCFTPKKSFAKELLHLQRLGRINHDNAPVVLLAEPKIPARACITLDEDMCMYAKLTQRQKYAH